MTALADLALDVGTFMTKVAVGGRGAGPELTSMATPAAGQHDQLAKVLDSARRQPAGDQAGMTCFAVPDSWLDGDISAARSFESMRHVVEDDLGLADVRWAGQMSAVAALAAWQHQGSADGRYLICDIGGIGVRALLCAVAGAAIRPLAMEAAQGGGWQDFDGAVHAALAGHGDPGLEPWPQADGRQLSRITFVLDRAMTDSDFRDTPACKLAGAHGSYELTGGQLIESFASTAGQIRTVLSAVLGQARPTATVLTGGLAWFPLVGRVVRDAVGMMPENLGPQAAAHGALLLGRGAAQLAPLSLPSASMPMHQIENGLLTEFKLPLPWTPTFAPPDGELPILDEPKLTIELAGQLRTVPLTNFAPGPCRIGLRPARPGRGLLVVRSDSAGPRAAVHISTLDLEPADD
jgi:hypothetical protein